MLGAGFTAGALWGGVSGLLRARGWLNEVFSTLLANYLAILLVQAIVYGPWRDVASANYPQSEVFAGAAWIPTIGGSRLHFGIVLAIVAALAFHLVLTRTRWGLEIRAIGGNYEAARRCGIPLATYYVTLLAVGGGVAGIAGMSEAAGLHHRLSPGISFGYGFVGFLVSWLAGHRPLLIPPMAFLLAVLASGGDILQITQSVPYAAVNVLMASILFVVLAARAARRAA
jgi:simple sugar transport system permease protein